MQRIKKLYRDVLEELNWKYETGPGDTFITVKALSGMEYTFRESTDNFLDDVKKEVRDFDIDKRFMDSMKDFLLARSYGAIGTISPTALLEDVKSVKQMLTTLAEQLVTAKRIVECGKLESTALADTRCERTPCILYGDEGNIVVRIRKSDIESLWKRRCLEREKNHDDNWLDAIGIKTSELNAQEKLFEQLRR